MSRLRLQLRTLSRDPQAPSDEEAWCQELVSWVRRAVERGRAGPAAVVRREQRVDLLSLALPTTLLPP